MPVDELAIPGRHNVSNALAAVARRPAVRRRAGRDPARRRGVHRASSTASSRSRVVDGVRFVNDSQGTQPDAVIAALRAFAAPIVLIAGGRDKGVDLRGLGAGRRRAGRRGRPDRRERRRRLRALFRAAGLARTRARADARGGRGRGRRDRPRAARPGRAGAPTATVLLSPAAASFDMFVDYAARGRAFKAAVAALARGRRRDGPPAPDPVVRRRDRRRSPPPATDGDAAARRPRAAPAGSRGPSGAPIAAGDDPPAAAPRAGLRAPRRRRGPGRDRHPDGLLVVGDGAYVSQRRRHVRDRRAAGRCGPAWASSRWSS